MRVISDTFWNPWSKLRRELTKTPEKDSLEENGRLLLSIVGAVLDPKSQRA
jgi:hypothetical protein